MNFIRKWWLAIALFLGLVFFAWSPVHAVGSYGLNKVQYEPFLWRQVQTAHFDIYYYQNADSLAAYTARVIEPLYDSSASYLNHRLLQRIPIILHSTHAQFEGTNVIRYPIPEAVGGFTEVFKNRIVLPFDGSYLSFHHVIQHELLHAMVFDLVSHGRRGYNTAAKLGSLPLWALEGNSEYGSIGWEIGSEFFLIDAVANGRVGNPAEDLPGYLAYKGGQNFLFFVESNWGKGTVAKILQWVAEGLSFDVAFLRATRVSLEEAGEIWLREVRRIYWPELGQRQFAKSFSRAMTDHRKEENFYNVNPAISPNGKQIAFFSDRGNWEAVYILDTETEKVTRTAIEGGHIATHESFHSFTSALSWFPDNCRIALVSKQNGRDVIHIVDTKKQKLLFSLDPRGLEAISSPTVSPDGKSIVFSGQKNAVRDLYRIAIQDPFYHSFFNTPQVVEPEMLTHDAAMEDRPVYSPSGRYIAFQSNREANEKDRAILDKQDIYLLDLKDLSVRRVTHNRWSSYNPTFGEDDSLIVYVSNRSGLDNLYMQNSFGDSLWPLSNVLTSVSSASWSRDGNAIAFSLFEGGGWDVFLMKDPWKHRILKPIARTRFIEVAEDTTGTQKIFEPFDLENLKTFQSKEAMDSLEREIRGHEDSVPTPSDVKSSFEPSEGLFLDPIKNKKDSIHQQLDSLRKDSTKVDTTHQDSSHVVVDLRGASRHEESDSALHERLGWDYVDTATMFLARHDSTAFLSGGLLRSKPYETQWGLDQAVALAGFSSMDGLGGQGAVTLSDLMGDQEINFWFFGGGSFDNLNLYASYAYLPLRFDMSSSIFHTYSEGYEDMSYARFCELRDTVAPAGSDTVIGSVPYGDRSLGAAFNISWPFSIFSRLDLTSQLNMRTRKYLKITDQTYDGSQWVYETKEDTAARRLNLHSVDLALGWSFDNAQWGITGPMEGQRLWLGVQGIPPGVLQDKLGYWRVDTDLRKYFAFYHRYAFAFRVAGGMSEPIKGYEDPHRYLLGGDEWTINWHFNDQHWQGSQEDVYFGSWETPLRGFRYHDFAGTRMAVANAEFRFPFINMLSFGWPIPLTITNVMGSIFTDYGGTWENREVLKNRGWGYGWGWRLNLGVFVLRYTRAWSSHEFSTVDRGGYTYWSLGAEF